MTKAFISPTVHHFSFLGQYIFDYCRMEPFRKQNKQNQQKTKPSRAVGFQSHLIIRQTGSSVQQGSSDVFTVKL